MPHIAQSRITSPRSSLPKSEVVTTWSFRLVPTKSCDKYAQVNMNASPPLSTKEQEASQLLETGLLRQVYDAPPLHTPDQRPVAIHGRNEQQPRGRGRSMSHSFLSIPHGNKKGRGNHTAMECDSGDRNNRAMFSASTPQSLTRSRGSRSTNAQLDRDLTTGKCMTCDSMVRWPKELAVFRCSVCVTINDLTPISTVQDSGCSRRSHSTREPAPSQNSSLSRGRQAYNSCCQDRIHYI